jgi:hypothetical protein
MDFKLRRLLRITANKLVAVVRAVFSTGRKKGAERTRQWPKKNPRALTSF